MSCMCVIKLLYLDLDHTTFQLRHKVEAYHSSSCWLVAAINHIVIPSDSFVIYLPYLIYYTIILCTEH